MLYWNSGPIWLVGGSRKRKALPPYGSSKIKFVDRLVASIFPSQDGCLSDITCLRHPSPSPPINLISAQDSRSRSLEAPERLSAEPETRAGSSEPLSATGRKIRGRQAKTFTWRTSPPTPRSPHPCQKLPDTLQAGALGERGGTKKDSKRNAGYFLRQYVGRSSKYALAFGKKKNEQSTACGKRPEH